MPSADPNEPPSRPDLTVPKRLHSGGAFEETAAYCRAVRAGPTIVVSGCAAIGNDGKALYPGDSYNQTRVALEVGLSAVLALGGTVEAVVRSRLFLATGSDWQGAVKAHREAFRNAHPANTTLFVAGFIPEGVLVEVELDAFLEHS